MPTIIHILHLLLLFQCLTSTTMISQYTKYKCMLVYVVVWLCVCTDDNSIAKGFGLSSCTYTCSSFEVTVKRTKVKAQTIRFHVLLELGFKLGNI